MVASAWTERGFPPGRAATTDLRIERTSTGAARIVEADIYLNAADFRFVDASPGPGELDLLRVLLHEQLHQAGLAHPCERDGASDAPDCANEAAFLMSAVYPEYQAATGLALSADDEAGLCALYAISSMCEPACASGERCLGGVCVPCAADAGCGATPVCDGGVCRTGCTSDTLCSDGVCAIAGPAVHTCVADGEVGARCASGETCLSNLCFQSAGLAFCTVRCDHDEECGAGLVCGTVDATLVCRTPPQAASCSARTTTGSRATAGVGLALAILALGRVTRLRRQTS